jgi:hypothetical protein
MRQQAHAKIIEVVLRWATAQPTIRAVALVGSYARGAARADSDLIFSRLLLLPIYFAIQNGSKPSRAGAEPAPPNGKTKNTAKFGRAVFGSRQIAMS